MTATYDAGDVVRCAVVFTNTAGVAADPSAVMFTFVNPAGVATTYTYGTDAQLVKDSTGNYHVDVAVPRAKASFGNWYVSFWTTGTGQTHVETGFYIQTSHVIAS